MPKQAALCLCATLTFVSAAFADAPNQITYQGRLQENGALVNGTRTVEIELCDALTAGNCYSANPGGTTVSVSAGIFKLDFPVPASVNLETGNWYLKLTVNGNAMAPRERLASHPYAQVASSVAASGIRPGVVGTGVHFADNVGIATASPGARLHVNGTLRAGVAGTSLVVAPTGNVGIGTTGPSYGLSVASVTEIMAFNPGSTSAPFEALRIAQLPGYPMGMTVQAPSGAGILNLVLNAPDHINGANTANPGAFFRIDGRDSAGNPMFAWWARAAGSTSSNHIAALSREGYLTIGSALGAGQQPYSGRLSVLGTGASFAAIISTAANGSGNNLVVTNGGNVGIGTSSPNTNVHFAGGGIQETLKIEQTTAGNDSNILLKTTGGALDHLELIKHGPGATGSTAGILLDNLSRILAGAGAGALLLQVGTANPMHFVTNNAERLRITSSGEIGIGTTSPAQLLHLMKSGAAGTARLDTFSSAPGDSSTLQLYRSRGTPPSGAAVASGDGIGAIEFGGHDGSIFASRASIKAYATQVWTGTTRGTKVSFWTTQNGFDALTERMVIMDDGKVGIGHTSPSERLHVDGGHIRVTGASPSLSAGCGTGASVAGSDVAGEITLGSAATGGSCMLTFASSWSSPPVCMFQNRVQTQVLRVSSVSSADVTFMPPSGSLSALDLIGYICIGR